MHVLFVRFNSRLHRGKQIREITSFLVTSKFGQAIDDETKYDNTSPPDTESMLVLNNSEQPGKVLRFLYKIVLIPFY